MSEQLVDMADVQALVAHSITMGAAVGGHEALSYRALSYLAYTFSVGLLLSRDNDWSHAILRRSLAAIKERGDDPVALEAKKLVIDLINNGRAMAPVIH